MSLDIKLRPSADSAAYSAMPLRLYEPNHSNLERYKYLINIVWDNVRAMSISGYQLLGDIKTRVYTDLPHNFKKGDTILFDDSANNNIMSGYFNIIKILSDTSFVIDVTYTQPLVYNANVSHVIKYEMPPDIEGEAKLDISNTIKNFVTQNIEDTYKMFNAPNSIFNYSLKLGSQYTYQLEYQVANTTGTHYQLECSSLTNVNQIDYQIGDIITIQQKMVEWPYYDNQFDSGALAFIGNTPAPNFPTGANIEVTGQVYQPSYNGPTSVVSVVGNLITTEKTFLASTPADDGVIYGMVANEYNTSAKITNIQYIYGRGVVITTDLEVGEQASVGGITRFADNRTTFNVKERVVNPMRAYNARLENFEYSVTGFDKYTTMFTTPTPPINDISTIYNVGETYNIERSAKSWLLYHMRNPSNIDVGPVYTFYNSNGVQISQYRLANPNRWLNFHVPIGVNQLLDHINNDPSGIIKVSGGDLPVIVDDIVTYTLEFNGLVGPNLYPSSKILKFKLTNECSSYELLHLIWKDSKGSWISLPFKMKSYNTLEADRATFYKKEGNWSNNDFGYPDVERGETNFHSKSRESKKVNSGWMEEFEVRLVKDLFKSASVFIQAGDGKLTPCHIDNKSIELIKGENGDLIQYQFDLRYSSNDFRY